MLRNPISQPICPICHLPFDKGVQPCPHCGACCCQPHLSEKTISAVPAKANPSATPKQSPLADLSKGKWVKIDEYSKPIEKIFAPLPTVGTLSISAEELHAKNQRITELEQQVRELGGHP